MGGTAFARKGIDTVRLPLDEYEAASAEIMTALAPLASGLPACRVVPHYRSKTSFGDLDIVVDRRLFEIGHEAIASALGAMAFHNMGGNDPVLSLAIATPRGPFQVDLISVLTEHFDYAVRYFSWGDAGSLASAIGRQMGLRHGQNGLRLFFDEPGRRLEVPLTNSYDEALEFLGLDVTAHHTGFETPEQVYRWISQSPYFDPAIYQVERLTNDARHRVSRRSFYSDFLAWMRDAPANYDWGPKESRLAEWQPRIIERFPHASALMEAERTRRSREPLREFFSGRFASEVSGVQGEALQFVMHAVRTELGDDGLSDLHARDARDELATVIRRVANNFTPAHGMEWTKPK